MKILSVKRGPIQTAVPWTFWNCRPQAVQAYWSGLGRRPNNSRGFLQHHLERVDVPGGNKMPA